MPTDVESGKSGKAKAKGKSGRRLSSGYPDVDVDRCDYLVVAAFNMKVRAEQCRLHAGGVRQEESGSVNEMWEGKLRMYRCETV